MELGFFVFLGVFAVVLFASAVRNTKPRFFSSPNGVSTGLISVIIPFRNEEKNLPQLIQAILAQRKQPHEILFIDDHSEDNGKQLLEKAFKEMNHISSVTLPSNLQGKKQAIHFGVQNSTGDYCLTLDADVQFHPDYFQGFSSSVKSDMLIGPVVMNSASFWSRLFAFEYMLFNAFNFAFSSLYMNTASGANLLFSRKKYLELNTLGDHGFLSSGDDHFLLRDFQKANAHIEISNNLTIAVQTNSVRNWSDYFNQRIRWISKTKSKSNWKEMSIGLMLTLYLIGSYIWAISFLIQHDYSLLFGIIGLRFVIDLFVYSNYASRLGKLSLFIWYPLFFIIYPIVFTFVLIGSVFYKPRWKGRPITRKV